MKIHTIKNDKVKVGVTEECGHLHPVRFFIDNKVVEPLNIAPWINEKLDDSIPPMLKMLRGDFFCMPFSNSDVLKDEDRAHGTTANDKWNLISKDNSLLEFKLDKKVSGAEIIKRIKLNSDHPVIYQEHKIIGGEGKIPIGHHLMLKVPEKIYLSFSDFLFGETPLFPVETDPEMGNSIFKYPQQFTDLTKIKSKNDGDIDLSRYPVYQDHEDLLMLKSDESLSFAWSAASAPRNGWLWFSIKNPKILNSTVLWLSDGGRNYPPFSDRHRKVIGIEEVTSYFHLGHKASIEKNHLNEKGYKTFIELNHGVTHSIKYAFGLVKIPKDFRHVISIVEDKNGIEIKDENNLEVHVNVDMSFITKD
ncbi:MAG: hypothetical protein EHM47_01065 [Ignavibacteriales bacterium]|nr:MAG: hypothetical protein EHM47_01065 [Ignavibacteriales bacterium]